MCLDNEIKVLDGCFLIDFSHRFVYYIVVSIPLMFQAQCGKSSSFRTFGIFVQIYSKRLFEWSMTKSDYNRNNR